MLSGVSVIIPVYNEADILVQNSLRLLKYLKELRIPFEIIIGSNGSDDSTEELGYNLAEENKRIRFFSLSKKGIVGEVFRIAARMARYEKLVTLDIDLTIDLSFISVALNSLEVSDMVVGSKKAGKEARTWVRRLASTTYIWIVRNFLRLEFSDYSIGAKAYRCRVVLPYLSRIEKKTGYVLTLIFHLYRDGKRIVQIPVDCFDRRGSKFSLVGEGLYRFFHLLSFRLWGRKVKRI